MIELPEALTIAKQISKDLKGKKIKYGNRGNSPHKFAFYNHSPEEYESILTGKTIGDSKGYGSLILTAIDPEYILILGGGGEKIILQQSEKTIPKKYQLLLQFEDDTYLTVTVQGWGFTQLKGKSEIGNGGVSPISDEFTFEYFQRLFDDLREDDPRSAKYFIISKPGIWGVGNGYSQDILFRAKIHPRRRIIELTEYEKSALYEAIKDTMSQAVKLGGRDDESDLYNNKGGYKRILDSRTNGTPCQECGTTIEKISFLGGASYFCPNCQIL
ncbi:endonuclease VIII [Patescibacteria group bacterium]|nr:endonuclease VIII [Patescibacteria group bacterium]